MIFAKIFNENYKGQEIQVLVFLDSDKDGSKVTYKVGYDEGISEMSIGFEDSDEGLKECLCLFEKTNKSVAVDAISKII